MEKPNLAKIEESVLEFWQKEEIFEKLEGQKRTKKFVFYEGPPTANAGPAFHHVIARAFKDIIPRYKTLKGFSVSRKAGWDTHGLPVELQIEKKIGVKTKPEIEKFGIAKFNRLCQESVWEFKQLWDKFTERIGYWLDLKNPYITYDINYMESVWWILRKIWDKGLLEKDYKVVPYCARCGTPLSSHEVALGYEDIEEISVYLKFKLTTDNKQLITDLRSAEGYGEASNQLPTYFLAWTTTPWTLPGNVALAVNPEIDYVFVETTDKEVFILAKNRLSVLTGEYEVLKEFKGKDLVGLKYEPLFDCLKNAKPKNIENAFRVYPAEFATDADGTGIVHTAVMYGDDDFNLGKEFSLPFIHTVDFQGKFFDWVDQWKGVWVKDADPLIREELKKQNKLLQEEKITHTYPFCWRCNTPLLYYACDSWFIRTTKVKDMLIANNEKIRWEPEHLQHGRFGEWLRENKDWALSRDRFWGTPLPIWECEKNRNHRHVVGSIKEFSDLAWFKNKYIFLRHGEADSNAKQYHSDYVYDSKTPGHLTETGKKQVENAAKKLASTKVDLIISSDLARTKETAEILKKYLPDAKVVFDERLREISAGVLSGKTRKEFDVFYAGDNWFVKKPENGESFQEVLNRAFAAFKDFEKNYSGKTILVISHNGVLWPLLAKLKNQNLKNADVNDFGLAEAREFVSKNLPYNEKNEIDLHRPYVDEIFLKCQECDGKMSRVKEVIDVWFDSGAMPLAQFHFPFNQMKPGDDPNKLDYQKLLKTAFDRGSHGFPVAFDAMPYPADYISEAIDQTRGWFYTLLAISTLLDLGPAYLSVVSIGHVVDKNGEKMSKSKGNIVDPWEMIAKYGADSLRWYFYTVNSPGEYKKFSEKDLAVSYQELTTVLNVLRFFEFYVASDATGAFDALRPAMKKSSLEPVTLLDKWILARLGEVVTGVDKHLSENKIFEASRLIRPFIDDISRWYLRRSRKRFQKPESQETLFRDSEFFAGLLLEFSKVLAPFTPFLAENIWQTVNQKLETKFEQSVHLSSWPELKQMANGESLMEEMQKTRKIAELGLMLRAKAGIKVRQPLSALELLTASNAASGTELSEGVKQILCEELNVKEIKTVGKFSEGIVSQDNVGLDVVMTESLKREGENREISRGIQGVRQELGFMPQDKVSTTIAWSSGDVFGTIYVGFDKDALKRETNSQEIIFQEGISGKGVKIPFGDSEIEITIRK